MQLLNSDAKEPLLLGFGSIGFQQI